MKALFKPRPAQVAGRALYAAMVAQARQPALYRELGAPDTPEGRFEVYSLHVYLVLQRLKDNKDNGAQAAEVAQALFDTYVSSLDNALRELAVGDLSVGKRMRKLGEAFFGRVKSYEAALAALPDRSGLEALIARTVYDGVEGASPAPLADYVLAQRHALAAQPLERFFAGEVAWSAP